MLYLSGKATSLFPHAAYASRRGSWANIIASDKGSIPDYHETLVLTVRSCLQHQGELNTDSYDEVCGMNEETIRLVREIVELPYTKFLPHIDATHLHNTASIGWFDDDMACMCDIFPMPLRWIQKR